MFKKMKLQVCQFFRWYILGQYHCDHCPYCWSEYSYEGDGDCGCYIRGDIQDTCRLIPPFRFFLGWPRKKQQQYWNLHSYDGTVEWFEQEQAREIAYGESILILLKDFELYTRDSEGKLIPVCKAELTELYNFRAKQIGKALSYYESVAHLPEPTLKQQWKTVIKKTWKKFTDVFKPFFS